MAPQPLLLAQPSYGSSASLRKGSCLYGSDSGAPMQWPISFEFNSQFQARPFWFALPCQSADACQELFVYFELILLLLLSGYSIT